MYHQSLVHEKDLEISENNETITFLEQKLGLGEVGGMIDRVPAVAFLHAWRSTLSSFLVACGYLSRSVEMLAVGVLPVPSLDGFSWL